MCEKAVSSSHRQQKPVVAHPHALLLHVGLELGQAGEDVTGHASMLLLHRSLVRVLCAVPAVPT